MLTPRGWSILIFTFFLLVAAMLDWVLLPFVGITGFHNQNTTLEVLGLALTAWFCAEWLLFAFRARVVARQLHLTRELHDERGPIDVLWTRQGFHVRLVVRLADGWRLPYVRLSEELPHGAQQEGGECLYEGPIESAREVEIHYRLRCTAIGSLRFEGVRVQLADAQGFFYFSTFLASPHTYRILPPLADDRGHAATAKRYNLLPPPGVHRLRRAGSGSELLDLRDYLPGDPPKMIAWKASARRDRLITKEFESEVPLRCTLFVDTSESARRGGPGANALTRLVEVAACVAQANAAARDLTGLCLFGEEVTSYLRPARGPRHLATIINRLTDAAGMMPAASRAPLTDLQDAAYGFAERVYPDQLRTDLNYFPEWLPWLWPLSTLLPDLPWLRPQSVFTMKRPRLGDAFFQGLTLLVTLYVIVAATLVSLGTAAAVGVVTAVMRGNDPGFAAVAVGIGVLGMALLFLKLPGRFFSSQRRSQRRRKHLAALLSVRYGLAPGGLSLLAEDDDHYVHFLQRFLAEHRIPFTPPRVDPEGKPLPLVTTKVGVLAEALLRAVSKEHDNELFVLFADVVELRDDLEPLIRAVRIAVARHHQVILVLAWPPQVPAPIRDQAAARDGKETSVGGHWQRAYEQIQRALAPLGVSTICAADAAPTRGAEKGPGTVERSTGQAAGSSQGGAVPATVPDSFSATRLVLSRLERMRLQGGRR